MNGVLLLLVLVWAGAAVAATEKPKPKEPKGIIGRAFIDGLPVIYKFVNEAPSEAKRRKLPWLAVVSWEYDGSQNNGMPPRKVNARMIVLEEALESGVVKDDFCEHAISRTGSNLKELIYYIHDRDVFIEKLNDALADHERYPIKISFYKDPEWKEFSDLRADFNKPRKEGASGELPVNPEEKSLDGAKPKKTDEERSG